ncbi:unnamed protein product, partial [Soboliphyme baturini]|uniref:separase n=1 Tax=Soboliphyme baturini TaxID=241478 RepID=A0A183J6F0_9BILA
GYKCLQAVIRAQPDDATVYVVKRVSSKSFPICCLVYCGHGGGSKYIKTSDCRRDDCKASVLLMGCSSALTYRPGNRYETLGTCAYYQIAKSPNVVGTLWDVTDKEMNRYLEALLTIWLGFRNPNREQQDYRCANISDHSDSLLQALAYARNYCKLPFLTGAAIVSYGLPLFNGN